jgi:dienelactone hydrolase
MIERSRMHRRTSLRSMSCLLALLASVGGLNAAAAAERAQVLADVARMDAEHRDRSAWDRRRAELREGFLKGAGLWPLPKQGPLRVERRSLRRHDGYTVENVAIETLPGFYCTGNLYRPSAAHGQTAGVLCPHGHFKPLGRFRPEQQIRCAHLALMGATVLSYAMVGWQDSTQTTHDDPNVLALQTWNSLKALDFLCGLPDVDAARIGATGASGGGTQTLYLALLDDRVKASAPVVILYPWSPPDGCCRCEGGLPIMRESGSNCFEFAAAIAPRPQLVVSVGHDPTHDFPEVGYPFIRRAYAACGAAGDVESVLLPKEQHDFGPSKRAAVYLFLARHLRLAYADEVEGRVAIEEPAAMEVFNAAHPRPAGAVSGSAAVAKALASLHGR